MGQKTFIPINYGIAIAIPYNLGREDQGEAAHAGASYQLLANPGIKDEFVQAIFRSLDNIFNEPGKETQRMTLYQDVLEQAQIHLDERNGFRMKLTEDLAKFCMELEDYPKAQIFLRQVLAVRQEIMKEDFTDLNENTKLISGDAVEGNETDVDAQTQPVDPQEEQSEVEKAQAEADEMQARALIDEHSVAVVYAEEDLGIVLQLLNKLDEAQSLLHGVLTFKKAAFGPCDPSTLDTAHRLGEICEALGKLEEAEAIHQEFEVAALEMQIAKLQERLKQGSHSHEVTMQKFAEELGDLKIKCVEGGQCE